MMNHYDDEIMGEKVGFYSIFIYQVINDIL